MHRRQFLSLSAGLAAFGALPARADGALARLAEPGVHAIMRHALAPGTGDPADFALRDCSTQRNLDSRGRQQSRAIGAMLREAGARFDRVLTSQWCRCIDTARLLDVAPVEEESALNSFFRASHRAGEQTAALKARLAGAKGETLLLVTHQVNVTALTDAFPASGELFVFRLGQGGGVEVLGEILLAA